MEAHIRAGLQRLSIGSFIFQSGVAAEFDLHPRDLEAISHLSLRGDLSAGELARLLDLSTGATTTLIDRIVRAGFASRVNDPSDGRRVVVRLAGQRVRQLRARYRSIDKRVSEALEGLSNVQLAGVATFLERLTTS